MGNFHLIQLIRKNFKFRTMLIVVLILIISLSLILTVNIVQFRSSIKSSLEREIYTSGFFIRNTIYNNLKYFSLDRLAGVNQFFDEAIKANNVINYIFISNNNWELLYHSDIEIKSQELNKDFYNNSNIYNGKKTTFNTGKYYESVLPLFSTSSNTEQIGALHIGVDKKVIDKEITKVVIQTIIIFGIAFIIFVSVMLLFITKKVVNPITKLSNEMKKISDNMDFERKIYVSGSDEIAELGNAFNTMINEINNYSENLEEMVQERTIELHVANRELKKKNEDIHKELEMARRVQEKLLPTEKNLTSIRELKFGSSYLAMEKIGGDIYDVMRIGKSTYGFYIADVSGHGVPAALITSLAKVSFTSFSNWNINTSLTCQKINDEMCTILGDLEHYLTAYYCKLDLLSGELQFTNCGHHPALLIRPNAESIIKLDTLGFFLGILDNVDYEEKNIKLQVGDKILLFTDGIIEARNQSKEFYGYPRLLNYIENNKDTSAKDFVDGLIENVEQFCGNQPPDDDRAVLYVEYKSNIKSLNNDSINEAIVVESRKIEKEVNPNTIYEKQKSDFDKAIDYIKVKKYQKAHDILSTLINENDDVKVNYMMGLTLYRLGRYEEAYNILLKITNKGYKSVGIKKLMSIISRKYLHTDNPSKKQ